MRLLTWRIPNVVLACPVDLAEERRVASAKRTATITLPPGTSMEGVEYITGADGTRWRVKAVSVHEALAYEV